MKVFLHHIYEYKKGLRHLILHTTAATHKEAIDKILTDLNISHIFVETAPSKINVFFGDSCNIEIIRTYGYYDLSNFTNEQDLIPVALPGHNSDLQNKRYSEGKYFDSCTEYFLENLLFPELERKSIYAS